MKLRSLSVEGSKTPVYCTKHAKSRIVGVYARRRLNDACMYRPNVNVDGSKTPVYCKQHAQDGMIDVLSKRC